MPTELTKQLDISQSANIDPTDFLALEAFKDLFDVLNLALLVSVALALWSAKAGVSSLMTGLNIANQTVEKRSFIVQQLVALALTVGAAILAVVVLAGVGPHVLLEQRARSGRVGSAPPIPIVT